MNDLGGEGELDEIKNEGILKKKPKSLTASGDLMVFASQREISGKENFG